jgi:uracil-DNA glycosylase family 4
MLDEECLMGGEHDRMTAAEAASVLGWWIEAGVDVATQEQPRTWLSDAGLGEAAAPAPEPHLVSPPIAEVLPATLDAFRGWLGETAGLPFAASETRRVLPQGIENAEIMLLADMPAPEDLAGDTPIAGPAWELTQRMLSAIGFGAEQAYLANLSCIYRPGARLSGQELEACAAIVRRQIALAKPKRLLLLGDRPCQALVGKPLTTARGHVHKIEGVRTVATFHPRQLLQRASDKALAWRDLLLLMEEDV